MNNLIIAAYATDGNSMLYFIGGIILVILLLSFIDGLWVIVRILKDLLFSKANEKVCEQTKEEEQKNSNELDPFR